MNSMFDVEMDFEEVIEVPEDYLQVRLSELSNGEKFTGKPQISGILTSEYDELDDDGNPIFSENGEIKVRKVHKLRFVLVNDTEEQYLDININLKQNDYQMQVIRKGSVLFDFIQSILELENPGATHGKNIFRNTNIKQFMDWINTLKVVTIQNIERKGRYSFNSFKIIRANNKIAE